MSLVAYDKNSCQFLENHSTIIELPNGDKWYYMPYWFKKEGDGNVYRIERFEDLPSEVIEYIQEQRKIN